MAKWKADERRDINATSDPDAPFRRPHPQPARQNASPSPLQRTNFQRHDLRTPLPFIVVDNGAIGNRSDALVLDENGNLTIDGTLTQNADTSDRRLKTGIEPLREAVLRTLAELRLLGTAPNPARNRATVRYAVPEGPDGKATLRLYDVLGRQVRTVKPPADAGRHEQMLDVSDLRSGVYVLRLQAAGQFQTRKLTVVQ
jgi:hypothetical protein